MKKEYKNQTIYIRESYNEEHPFTIISNHIVNDENLSAIEKGIMLMILSNSNDYVLNSTYLQKQSGLGKVTFNKALRKLKNIGYLIKKPLKNGGYKWIVMESTLIYEELQKIGYLKYDNQKSSWIIDENMEDTLQLFDFHRMSENGKPRNGKPRSENPDIGKADNRIPDSQPIINNNITNTNFEEIQNEEKENEINNNIRQVEDLSFQNVSSLSENESEEEGKKPSQNSLPILLEVSEGLRNAFENNSISIDALELCTDSYIANVFLSLKLSNKYSNWEEALKYTNHKPEHYGVYVYAGRSALEYQEETELKRELVSQSNMTAKELYKTIYRFDLPNT